MMPSTPQDDEEKPALVLRSVYLPEETDSRLLSIAFTRDMSQADLIREMVEQGIAAWKAAGGRTLAECVDERVRQRAAAKLGIDTPPAED